MTDHRISTKEASAAIRKLCSTCPNRRYIAAPGELPPCGGQGCESTIGWEEILAENHERNKRFTALDQ